MAGLYDWNEAMQYSTTEGAQGVCPQGWHIPSDGEWCALFTYLDPTVNCSVVNNWTGTNVGGKVKEAGTHIGMVQILEPQTKVVLPLSGPVIAMNKVQSRPQSGRPIWSSTKVSQT